MRICGVLAVGLAAVLLVGCGGGGGTETETAVTRLEGPDKVKELFVGFSGWESPDTVSTLMAEKRGYFTDAGFKEVFTYVPVKPMTTLKDVIDGSDNFGISYTPQVVLAREKGAPITIVGSLIPQSTTALIWLKGSGIGGIADLRGKTIATPGLPFQKEFLRSLLVRGGLTLSDVKVENVGYNLVSALASGRADAIFGGSWNLEGVNLESRGLKPVITRAQDLGIPAYDELVVVTRSARVSEEPQVISAFMSVISRGTAAALEDPKGVVDVLDAAVEGDSETSRKALEGQSEVTLPLLSKGGYVSPSQIRHLVDWMHEQGMIKRVLPVSTLLTNDFVTSPGG